MCEECLKNNIMPFIIENKHTQETKDLGNLFQQHLTKKDPPNQ